MLSSRINYILFTALGYFILENYSSFVIHSLIFKSQPLVSLVCIQPKKSNQIPRYSVHTHTQTHTKVKNKAAEQKNPVSVTEASLQQDENHMWPGKYRFKEFWTYFLIPIRDIFFKYESTLNVRHL